MTTSRRLLTTYQPKKVAVTYQQFVDHAVSTYPYQPLNSSGWTGTCYTYFNAETGTMWGTSLGGVFTSDSNTSRIIQHAIPPALYAGYFAGGRVVIMTIQGYGYSASFRSVTINGYMSYSYTGYTAYHLPYFVYWDDTRQQAMYYNPFAETAPAEYRFT